MLRKRFKNPSQGNKASLLYRRANEEWRKGRLRSAFRLMLAAAEAGATPAFRIVAQFYDDGEGVRRNKRAALYWYRLAYYDGDGAAANNIGCIWRDRDNFTRALFWFQRAVELGDADANLNIAKIYLRKGRLDEAARYLEKTSRSRQVTAGSREEARVLLTDMRGKATRRAHRKKLSKRAARQPRAQ